MAQVRQEADAAEWQQGNGDGKLEQQKKWKKEVKIVFNLITI